ncbi:MAG: M48 family metallopeptidase [Bacteriovoracia bacterium]
MGILHKYLVNVLPYFFLISIASQANATTIQRVEFKSTKNADVRLMLNADDNKHPMRYRPSAVKHTESGSEVAFEFTAPIDTKNFKFEVVHWGSTKNLQLDRFEVGPHFIEAEKPSTIDNKDKKEKSLNLFPFATLGFDLLGDLSVKQTSIKYIDPDGNAWSNLIFPIDIDCSQRVTTNLENDTLTINFLIDSSLLDCAVKPDSDQTDAYILSKIGKRRYVDKSSIQKYFEEQKISNRLLPEVREELKDMLMPNDHPVTVYLQSLLDRIAKKSDLHVVKPTVVFVDTDQFNAFTIGGGYIFVFRKLLEEMPSEAALAAVVGHEWGHVVGHHMYRTISKTALIMSGLLLGNLAYTALKTAYPELAVDGMVGFLGLNFIAGTIPLVLGNPSSRDREAEADFLGNQYTMNSGFSSFGAVDAFISMRDYIKDLGVEETESYQNNHPITVKRIAATSIYTGLFVPDMDTLNIASSPEFEEMKKTVIKMAEDKEKEKEKKKKKSQTSESLNRLMKWRIE